MELSDARALALALMQTHGVGHWHFRFDSSRRRFGACHHRKEEISLSRSLTSLNDEGQVRDTILHEIAHAVAGAAAGHGATWRRTAARLGADPRRTYDSDSVVTPPAPYLGTCPHCALTVGRHRRNRVACAACCRRYNGGVFSETYLLVWAVSDTEVRPASQRAS